MKIEYLLIICLCLLGTNCRNSSTTSFNSKCGEEEMPPYDYRASPVGEMTPELDSMLRIEKRRDVFKPCRTLVYQVDFSTESGEVISSEEISITATGKRWEFDHVKQDELLIEYNFDEESIGHINKYQLNKAWVSTPWLKSEITGVIENVEQIWMHPFRSNQYYFTQVAPFPHIELPLEIGKTWTYNKITLKEGFGDWSNMKVATSFEVLSKKSVETKYGAIDNCWNIKGVSKFPLGESELDFWFNKNLGFVKMEYVNYGNQNLKIELKNVINNSK